MRKEVISKRQAVSVIIMFIFGSSVVMGVSTEAAQDAWLSVLLGGLFAVPALLMYARIIRLCPDKDIFEIIDGLLGKVVGKIFIALLSWYALHLCALVLRNFSEFIEIMAMPETPQLPLMILMLLVTAYIAKSGVESLGKFSVIVAYVVIAIVFLTVLLALKRIDATNLQPYFAHNLRTVTMGAFQLFTFPFAETVLFLSVAGAVKLKDKPHTIYFWGLGIGTFVLLIIILRNIVALGVPMIDITYFPSYITARVLDLGDYFSRIEGTISINFILAGIVKISLCLLAATKGTARLFEIQDHRKLVMPVGLLVLALCAIIYKNTMEMFDFIRVYQFYAIPFQIIIPLAVWITAEIKARAKRKAAGGAASGA